VLNAPKILKPKTKLHRAGFCDFGASVTCDQFRHCKIGLSVHGINAGGKVVMRRQLKRGYVLPEAIAMSAFRSVRRPITGRANFRRLGAESARCLKAYVKPYVKPHKNDAADAEANCERSPGPAWDRTIMKSPFRG